MGKPMENVGKTLETIGKFMENVENLGKWWNIGV
jgi:hypothetical protein